jgi:dTMP kinase
MPTAFPPVLISFEGIDGSGKSTQAALLVRRLQQEGVVPLAVREPGGTPISEAVRDLLLNASSSVSPRAELLLFAAARAELVDEVIMPALEAGQTVVCDRFFDSTTAYQGGGRALASTDWLEQFHRFTTGGLVPHRTYLFDVPVWVAASRRGPSADRMEAAGEAFFARVRDAYLLTARRNAHRFRVLDGTLQPEILHKEVWEDVCALLQATRNESSERNRTP